MGCLGSGLALTPSPGSDAFDAAGGRPSSPWEPLHRALQDLAMVFFVSSMVYVAFIVTGVLGLLLSWFRGYPFIASGELFVFATLLAVGFGLTGLHRWTQLAHGMEEQKRIRGALKEHERSLEQRNEEIERLSYALAHDLREPLRITSNYLGLLDRHMDAETLDAEQQGYLEGARNATGRLESMVRSLLEYATVSPRTEESQPTDADAALDRALDGLFAHNPDLDTVAIHRGELPSVHAQPRDLEAVFVLLVENAIEHGGPEVSHVEITAQEGEQMACIRVKDDGVGIKPSLRDRVFQAFRHNSGSSSTAGAGMGLALCRRLIERHGGRIRVEDSDEGACFRIDLPLAGAPVETNPDPWQA